MSARIETHGASIALPRPDELSVVAPVPADRDAASIRMAPLDGGAPGAHVTPLPVIDGRALSAMASVGASARSLAVAAGPAMRASLEAVVALADTTQTLLAMAEEVRRAPVRGGLRG